MALFAGWLDAQIAEVIPLGADRQKVPIVHMDKADSMKLLTLAMEAQMAEERRNNFGQQLFWKYGLSREEYGLVIQEGIFKLIGNSDEQE